MAIKPIGLSFKNTAEDKELYEWIASHSNLSGFIKDILRAAKESSLTKTENNICSSEKSELIDLDF